MVTLLERKYMGYIQRRIGRNYSGYYGVLQRIYDGLKLYIKEILFSSHVHKSVYDITRILFIIVGISIYTLIRLYNVSNSCMNIFNNKFNIIWILILSGITGYSVLFSGFSSNTLYGIIGSLRCISQMVSYEVYFGLSLIVLLLTVRGSSYYNILSMNNIYIIQVEKRLIIGNWILFIIYFISIVGETNRSRLDIAESESELVSGWNTDYSAIKFAGFMIGEYMIIILLSYSCSIIFFSLSLFTIFIIYLFILIRASYRRLRQNDLLSFGWKYILVIIVYKCLVI